MGLNCIALCTVGEFVKEGHQFDKNENRNLYLKALSGRIPSKSVVLNGTVAINSGVEVGKTYLFAFDEAKADATYGRQFNTTKLKEVSAFETMEVVLKMGAATIIDVANAEVEKTTDIFANTQAESFK